MALQAVHNAQIPKVKLLQCIWWAPLHNNRQEEAYLRVSESMKHIIPIRHYFEQTWTLDKFFFIFIEILKWTSYELRCFVLHFKFCPRLPPLWQMVSSGNSSCQPEMCQGLNLFRPQQKEKRTKIFSNISFERKLSFTNILTPISIYDSFSVLQNVSPCPMHAAKAMAFGMNVCCLRPRNRWLWGPMA